MQTWKTSAVTARTSPCWATPRLLGSLAQQHGEDKPLPADKHLSSQPIPTARALEEVGMEDLDSHDKDEHSPPKKTADPWETRICLECGKDYNTTKKLNKQRPEVPLL